MRVKFSADNVLFLIMAVIPLLFMPYALFVEGGKAKGVYDAFYVGMSVVLLLLMPFGGTKFARRTVGLWLLFGIFLSWFSVKLYIARFSLGTDDNFYWVPFLREVKPAVYLLFCAVFISRWGVPAIESFIRAGTVFATLVLVSFALGLVIGDGGRPEVIDEANYDNFIVLLAFLATISKFGLRFDWRFLLFLIATLVSQSKTGVVCFFMLIAIFSIKRFDIKVLLQLILGAFVVLVVLYLRVSGMETVEDLDRFRMWLSYIDLVKDSSLLSFLFGFYPGVPLRYSDPYIGYFIVFQSEDELGILGLHPFNYHGMWLRLLCSWGIVPMIIGLLWFFLRFHISRANCAIILLVLVQGIGMGVFYLSTVAVPLVLFMAVANRGLGKNF